MDQITGKLTLLFEDPFWVGLYERTEQGETRVCRVVFGAEPKDYEVYAYFQHAFPFLRFSPPVSEKKHMVSRQNPKRMQRSVQKELTQTGIGTKAQQALKLQREQAKTERHERRKEQSEAEEQRKFELRQQKKKEKHKGH